MAKVIQLVMELDGVVNLNISTVKLNGVAQDITLGSSITFQLAAFDEATSALTYVKV